jgi:hypothetical protein
MMTPGRSSKGKRLAGKRHEPFERADGGRAAQPHLLRLYSRGSHAPPGLRVMPQQGEGPQPITEPRVWNRIALGVNIATSDGPNP